MSRAAFRKIKTNDRETIVILVDGELLIDLVRDAESESAAKEGRPKLAGQYGGLPWKMVATDLLLGEATGIWGALGNNGPHRVPLLLCDCGEPGCWPLIASIELTEDRVTWRDFRQPHRRDWDYSKLGPFSFDKTQYLAAIEEARQWSDIHV